jgi:hypothetical protein
MAEVKYNTGHHSGATPEARFQHRLRNSGGQEADHIIQSGSGSRRLFHNIHNSGSARQHGSDNKGEGDIYNQPRGSANPRGEVE